MQTTYQRYADIIQANNHVDSRQLAQAITAEAACDTIHIEPRQVEWLIREHSSDRSLDADELARIIVDELGLDI